LRSFGAVVLNLFGGIELDLVAAVPAPHYETDAGSG
jgi:hypothetical protein